MVFGDNNQLEISSKKVLTKGLGSDILINVVARTANTLKQTTAAILENDTEKQVILYKRCGARKRARMHQQSDSERVKRLDEMMRS